MSTPTATAGSFELRVSKDNDKVAYLALPTRPAGAEGRPFRTVRLRDAMGEYEGPEVILDFDTSGVLVGIEILP